MTHLLAAVGDTINLGNSLNDSEVLKPIAGTNFNIGNALRVGILALFIILTVGSFIYLLLGAVQWITAGGEKDGIEKAKKKITGAIVGLLIGFSVYAIIGIIGYITGTDFLNTLVIPHL